MIDDAELNELERIAHRAARDEEGGHQTDAIEEFARLTRPMLVFDLIQEIKRLRRLVALAGAEDWKVKF